jgi:hypothetical protein
MRYGFSPNSQATYETLLAETSPGMSHPVMQKGTTMDQQQAVALHQIRKLVQLPVHGRRLQGFGDAGWSDPYNPSTSSPPLVAVGASGSSSDTAIGIGSTVGSFARSLVNIFGQQQYPGGYPPGYVPPQPTPLWVYALLGVGGVVALGFVARSLRRPRSVAGYRRRRHHRR